MKNVKAHGLCAEADYPYVAGAGNASTCHPCANPAVKPNLITGGQQVGSTQQDLLAAVSKQPVSIAVEADQMAFQHYQSGVVTSSACGAKLDHAVLLVGFGEETGDAATGTTTPYLAPAKTSIGVLKLPSPSPRSFGIPARLRFSCAPTVFLRLW